MSFVFNDDLEGYKDTSLFPADLGEGIAGDQTQTTTDYIRGLQKGMVELQCSRCKMFGHERAACWYLTQMNLMARRLPDFGKRRRYAVIRKHAGKKGKYALK